MNTYNNPKKIINPFKIIIIGLCLSLVTSCSIVDISKQNPKQYLIDGRANIVTSKHLSNNSMGMLRMAGMEDKECLNDFATCINTLNERQFIANNPRQLALYAELHYAKAKQIKKDPSCEKTPQSCQTANHKLLLEAIRYSYGYLFADNPSNQKKLTLTKFANELDIQMQDIYYTATKHLIDELSSQILTVPQNIINKQKNISNKANLLTNRIYIDNYRFNILMPSSFLCSQKVCNNKQITSKLTNHTLAIDNLIATSTLKMTGLNSVSRRSGIGINYVAQKSDRYQLLDDKPNNTRIHGTGNMLLTALIKPHGNDLASILQTDKFSLHVYDAYQNSTISVLNKIYPLSANFSASYALWLNENSLQNMVGIVNMVRENNSVPLPHLYKLQPFDPNKKVIIMVHGLASSPITWVNLTNDLLNDKRLRDNYQVWQVFYSTHLPMLENRYYIQQLIEQAYRQHPQSSQAQSDSVLIAHSMGSLISRLMLSDNNLNSKFNQLAKKIYPKTPPLSIQRQQKQKLKLQPLKQVNTAVFIASPFRGTDFADKWVMTKLRSFIKLPKDLLKINKTNKKIHPLANDLFLVSGADQLSDKSPFITLTKDITINKNVQYHSIVGKYDGVLKVVNRNSKALQKSDGIVPYASSHLDGAKSETVIKGGHDIHTNAKTILQLRKILHNHLNKQ